MPISLAKNKFPDKLFIVLLILFYVSHTYQPHSYAFHLPQRFCRLVDIHSYYRFTQTLEILVTEKIDLRGGLCLSDQSMYCLLKLKLGFAVDK